MAYCLDARGDGAPYWRPFANQGPLFVPSFPSLFQLSGVLLVAVGLVKLLARPMGETVLGQWAVCAGACLASVVWLAAVMGAFQALFGFTPVLGGTLIGGL